MAKALHRHTGFDFMSKEHCKLLASKGGSTQRKSSANQGGFRLLSKKQRKEMAKKGAEAARKALAKTPELRKKWAKKGGIIAHASGVAHEFTSKEARAAGRKSWKARKKRDIITSGPVVEEKPPRTNWQTIAYDNLRRHQAASGITEP